MRSIFYFGLGIWLLILNFSFQASGSGDDDHGSEEESANVGPNKGITEANERMGFKLSSAAEKNFEITLLKLKGEGPWTIPAGAVVRAGEEVNLFRLRKAFYKRIDFDVIRKQSGELVVDSDDLREGDDLVTAGLGFLRISELAAFGGVAHGHSH